MHMFESPQPFQLAGFGKQSDESAPQQCSTGLFVNFAFIEGPTPRFGQDKSLSSSLLPSYLLRLGGSGMLEIRCSHAAGAPSM